MTDIKQLESEIIRAYHEIEAAATCAERLYIASLQEIESEFEKAKTEIEKEYSTKILEKKSEIQNQIEIAVSELQSLVKKGGLTTSPWEREDWNGFVVSNNTGSSDMLRIGETTILNLSENESVVAPVLIPNLIKNNIFLVHDKCMFHKAMGNLQSICWRMVVSHDPACYKFVLIDSVGLGSNLASLMHLPTQIRGTKIICQENEIQELLRQTIKEMEEIFQRRLLNTYEDIDAYNAENPSVAIPHTLLIIAGFPAGFSPISREAVRLIMETGKRAGIHLAIAVDKESKTDDIQASSLNTNTETVLFLGKAEQMTWTDPDSGTICVMPDLAPATPIIKEIAEAIQDSITAQSSKTLSFLQFIPLANKKWSSSSKRGLSIPVGINETGDLYYLSLGRGVSHHGLIGGATGSGKTNLLHLIIIMLTSTYSPAELELYLVDFKEGVEFQDYASHKLPHARAVVVEAEREYGLSTLQRLQAEMEKRGQLFKDAGATTLTDYIEKTGQVVSRILLIMDEYVVLFAEDDKISYKATEALGALVMRGRSYGIHVLLSSQRPASVFMSMNHIKSQMGLRIAFNCRADDSMLILGEGNDRAARLTKSGEACVSNNPDDIEATEIIQSFYVMPSERVQYLRDIRTMAEDTSRLNENPMVVFNRNSQWSWMESPTVRSALRKSDPTEFGFWIGQPIQMAEDVYLRLERQQGENVLISGNDEKMAQRIMVSAILGLACTTPPERVQFVCIASRRGNGGTEKIASILNNPQLPHRKEIVCGKESLDKLCELSAELDKRIQDITVAQTSNGAIVVAIPDIHYWNEIKGINSYTPSEAGECLVRLLRDGPMVGIHLILSVNRVSFLGSSLGSGSVHELLPCFRHRVAMQTSSDDSVAFLNVPDAAKLGKDRAYYRDEHWTADTLEKFKPYRELTAEEINRIGEVIVRN